MNKVDEKEKEYDSLVKNHSELKRDHLEILKMIPSEKPEISNETREVDHTAIYNKWKERVIK